MIDLIVSDKLHEINVRIKRKNRCKKPPAAADKKRTQKAVKTALRANPESENQLVNQTSCSKNHYTLLEQILLCLAHFNHKEFMRTYENNSNSSKKPSPFFLLSSFPFSSLFPPSSLFSSLPFLGCHSVAQDSLKLIILLFQPPEH